MSIREQLDVLEKVEAVAALAGLDGEIDEERMAFVWYCETDESRSQVVYVRPAGQTVSEEDVITIFSPCLSVKKGMLSGISKDQALDLLRQNEEALFGRFGIWSFEGSDMIVVSVDHILSSLDPSEFEMHMIYVAMMADKYEEKHSKEDDF